MVVFGLLGRITYPFPNSHGCTLDVLEWVSKFPTLYDRCNYYLCVLELKLTHIRKGTPARYVYEHDRTIKRIHFLPSCLITKNLIDIRFLCHRTSNYDQKHIFVHTDKSVFFLLPWISLIILFWPTNVFAGFNPPPPPLPPRKIDINDK